LTIEKTERLLYPRKDAAFALGISIRSLDYLIAGKQLDTRRIGKKVLVPRGALVRFASANHCEGMNTTAQTQQRATLD
jgi:hypothetical protein